jgi:SAM-dependent methyltransferase
VTTFELAYLVAEPALSPLWGQVRRRLKRTIARRGRPAILDVGGRKSHYTIGVPGAVTITDLPRETDLQHALNLGITSAIADQTRARRSNIHDIRLDDMTRSTLPDATFDRVVAVEVLEHVDADDMFVREVHRVLKPGGAFLMTTPNGDALGKPTNPDHRRHYTREQLRALLAVRFERVEVDYAIRGGRFRRMGLPSWSMRHPVRTTLAMVGNVLNGLESAPSRVRDNAMGTRHLIAIAWKPPATTGGVRA